MNTRKYSFEVKVGLFVIVALILLIVMVFSIGNFKLFKSGYRVKAYFNYVGGVEIGAPVRLAGVKVGEVKDIKILHRQKSGETIVEVIIWLQDDAVIRKGAVAQINTLGLLGEKYIEITPGRNGKVLENKDIIVGHNPIPISEFTSAGYEVFKKLNKTVKLLNELFTDKELTDSVKKVAINSKKLSESLIQLSSTTEKIMRKIEKGEGTLGKLILEDSLYDQIQNMIKDIKRHPWKLLNKPPERDKEIEGNRGYIYKRNQTPEGGGEAKPETRNQK